MRRTKVTQLYLIDPRCPSDRYYHLKNIFAEINYKKLAFLTQNKAKLCKFFIITLVFEKNANFLAENWQTLQKIVIISSTPGLLTFLLAVPTTNFSPASDMAYTLGKFNESFSSQKIRHIFSTYNFFKKA
jgi:hypothetical protein